ncbi:acetylglutamate kinase [Kordia sp. YSTF-M3]|uniref:Acetylglutamate kinase n=1 Tax=Kordia aestuariivivens TaxID=2759037 RepID=A0ABR7QC53_9FLAO|nr:acetylglutamate kinase [Kordia aestuariivivens]MBC8756140.1 acetylglutamate kinase [Kordia aestuariivivens]
MKTLKIIKIGGNIIDDEVALHKFLEGFAKLASPKLLVHGGGKSATKLAKEMHIDVQMNEGRRITDAKTLDIITMMYAGKINKMIVAKLQANNCNSLGFSGADGNSIVSVKRPIQEIDYGFVGDVKKVNTTILKVLLENKITPVFCAITHDENGQLLNTNADTIASELAVAFANDFKTELYYCFEKNGVLRNIQDDDSVIENITTETYQTLLNEGIIADGMLPKLNNCFYALQHQVQKVCIGQPTMLFQKNIKHTTIQQ